MVLGRNLLERTHTAHRRHPHLHRVAYSAYPGGHRGGDIRDHRTDLCGRSFCGGKARAGCLEFSILRFPWVRRPAIFWVDDWAQPRLAISVLYCGVARILVSACGRVSPGTGAWAIRLIDRNSRRAERFWASYAIRRSGLSTLGMAHDDFRIRRAASMDADLPGEARGYSLQSANEIFGAIIVVDGIVASLAGGWLGDYSCDVCRAPTIRLRRQHGARRPGHDRRPFSGAVDVAGDLAGGSFCCCNTSPLNAAVINSVGPHIRATALAVNIFIIHILGDVPSPTLMGYVADQRSLQAAFILPVVAMAVSSAILFYGMRFAPAIRIGRESAAS